jgi:hypothetical protein
MIGGRIEGAREAFEALFDFAPESTPFRAVAPVRLLIYPTDYTMLDREHVHREDEARRF